MATFGDVKTLVKDYLARSDVDSYLDRWVQNGQRHLERRLRIREMQATQTYSSVSSDTLSLPSKFLEDIGLFYKDSNGDFRPLSRKRDLSSLRMETNLSADFTKPRMYTALGDKIFLSSTPSSVDFDLIYFQAFDQLSADADTNWLTDNEPDLLVHAGLLFAQPFIIEDQRIEVWRAFVDQEVNLLNQNALAEQDNSASFAALSLGGSGQ